MHSLIIKKYNLMRATEGTRPINLLYNEIASVFQQNESLNCLCNNIKTKMSDLKQ
jgi:hypothetical protein